jgi:effector-binding domain-containing protein
MKTNLICLKILLAGVILSGLSINTARAQDTEATWSNTPFEVKEIDPVKALIIKAEIPMSEIGTKMGELYGLLYAYLETANIKPIGPPFAVYYTWDPEKNIVFEAGVPVEKKIKTDETVSYKEYEGMNALTTKYTGAYEAMEPVYTKLMEYMQTEKLESAGVSWEVYLTDPHEVESQDLNQTIIYFQLKD